MKDRFYGKHMAVILLLSGFSFMSLPGQAQQKQFQVWTDFNARFDLKNLFEINVEPGYRFEFDSDLKTAYLRTTLRYSPVSLLAFDVGMANFNVWESGDLSSFEIRAFQFIIINWPEIADFDFKIRLGLEQRWFDLPNPELKKFLHRARIRLGLRSPYFAFWQGRSRLYITSNVEILGNVNDAVAGELVDHSRYMLGLGFLDGRRFRLELQYQLIDLFDLDAFQTERDKNILHLRAFYYFKRRQG